MDKKLETIWNDTKQDSVFKEALINRLKSAYQTKSWADENWYAVVVIYGPTAVRADLDVQREDGQFFVYPTFMGFSLTNLDALMFPVEEVEGVAGLKEYEVRISHDVVEETTILVMAASPEDAIARARKTDLLGEADWSLTDAIGENQFEIVES
jgi:hypothetical protein